ncbi:MAG: hypothetical protein AAFZ49_08975 [Cyanobacteria bacterium J06659_2]
MRCGWLWAAIAFERQVLPILVGCRGRSPRFIAASNGWKHLS